MFCVYVSKSLFPVPGTALSTQQESYTYSHMNASSKDPHFIQAERSLSLRGHRLLRSWIQTEPYPAPNLQNHSFHLSWPLGDTVTLLEPNKCGLVTVKTKDRKHSENKNLWPFLYYQKRKKKRGENPYRRLWKTQGVWNYYGNP